MLGDYFLVGYPDRHAIVRDHVDLYEFAREIGALEAAARPNCRAGREGFGATA
jgi:hypothetical protein